MKFAEPTKLDRKSGGSGGICSSLNQHPIRTEATALPFVIPTAVEGSAVLPTSIGFEPKDRPTLCHPDRSGATVCFCQGREGWFGCGKGADEVRLGNAVRFPLSPNAAATGSLRHQNRSRWRFSEFLACFSSFGIESDQEFMSQSDTDYFFCFAGCS